MTLKTSSLEVVQFIGQPYAGIGISSLEVVQIFNDPTYAAGGSPIENGDGGGGPVEPEPSGAKKRRIVTLSTGYFPHV